MEITQEDLKKLVSMIAEEMNKTSKILPESSYKTQKEGYSRAILTALGMDKPGIVATISTELARMGINILEISQTIVSGYFTMIMLLDLSNSTKDFEMIKSTLEKAGEGIGVKVIIQKEEIFQFMHRI